MSEKLFKVLSGGFDEEGNPLYLIKDTTDMIGDMIGDYEIIKKVIEQQTKIKKLEEEKIELMEDNACQYRQIQKLESENEELMKKVFLFEKGISYLRKEEQMDLYTYVDLEMKRWRFDNE